MLGEMSLVGPRPERPHFVEQLAQAIPLYRQRAYVKPGLTGWAQVNYPYGASVEDAREKLSYDLYYREEPFDHAGHDNPDVHRPCGAVSRRRALTRLRAFTKTTCND